MRWKACQCAWYQALYRHRIKYSLTKWSLCILNVCITEPDAMHCTRNGTKVHQHENKEGMLLVIYSVLYTLLAKRIYSHEEFVCCFCSHLCSSDVRARAKKNVKHLWIQIVVIRV